MPIFEDPLNSFEKKEIINKTSLEIIRDLDIIIEKSKNERKINLKYIIDLKDKIKEFILVVKK